MLGLPLLSCCSIFVLYVVLFWWKLPSLLRLWEEIALMAERARLGPILFSTIGLLLVEFSYLQNAYERESKLLEAFGHPDQLDVVPVLESELYWLSVGCSGIYTALLIVYNGLQARRKSATLERGQGVLAIDLSDLDRLIGTAAWPLSNLESSTLGAQIELRRDTKAGVQNAIEQDGLRNATALLGLVIACVWAIHMLPMAKSASLIQHYSRGREHFLKAQEFKRAILHFGNISDWRTSAIEELEQVVAKGGFLDRKETANASAGERHKMAVEIHYLDEAATGYTLLACFEQLAETHAKQGTMNESAVWWGEFNALASILSVQSNARLDGKRDRIDAAPPRVDVRRTR